MPAGATRSTPTGCCRWRTITAASRAVKERLLATYFSEGGAIGDRATLAAAAAPAGLDHDQVAEMLAGDRYAGEVRADEHEAAQLGINAVPFFVIDRRYGLAGAQPPELLRRRSSRPGRNAANRAR